MSYKFPNIKSKGGWSYDTDRYARRAKTGHTPHIRGSQSKYRDMNDDRPNVQVTRDGALYLTAISNKLDELISIQSAILQHLEGDSEDTEPDNFDMSVDEVKELILKECNLGEKYYPGELAVDYGINYDTVLKAVDILRSEGHIED